MTAEASITEREIFISANPEVVFSFLVDPALMAHWFGLSRQVDARVGGKFEVEVSQGNLARGVYTEITAFRRVAFTWGWDSEDPTLAIVPPGASLVEIDLEPMGGGTLLRLRHSRLPNSTLRIHSDRWSVHLDRLRAEVQASVRVEQVNKGS